MSSTTTKPVFAELSEDGKRIEVYFQPTRKLIDGMHALNAKFQNQDKVGPEGTPHWTMDLDYEKVRQLVVKCGGPSQIEVGEGLVAWGQREQEIASGVHQIMSDEWPKLEVLPKRLPALAEAIHLGPLGKNMTTAERREALKQPPSFQQRDVAYMSFVDSPLNANHPGLGKTLEAIAAAFESGTADKGPNLIVTPITSIETVWWDELMRWQDLPVFYAAGEGRRGRARREAVLREAALMVEMEWPFWLIVNPDMVKVNKHDRAGGIGRDNTEPSYPFLHEVEWATIIGDEIHKRGLRNPQSVIAVGFQRLKTMDGGKKIALSGTPQGGKVINLFGPLHWLDPVRYPSKWKFAERYLQIETVVHSKKTGATHSEIGDVKTGAEQELAEFLSVSMIRHTKSEVLPWLPPKDRIDVWCSMTDEQAAQYRRFEQMAEVELGDETLSATSILAIYTRLKQFASAKCKFDQDGKLVPTTDSGKLQMLVDKLTELEIIPDEEGKVGNAQALVFSQFSEMVDMVHDHLKALGVRVAKITGDVKSGRSDIIRSFQDGGEGMEGAQVVVMTTTAGGVSITLDMADSVHILDETWNPDDQEQAEDRAHRASRIHQVTIYYYRTRGSIEEYIDKVVKHKGKVNRHVLDDLRRAVFNQKGTTVKPRKRITARATA